MHLVQLNHLREGRRVAVVEERVLRLVDNHDSVYSLVNVALERGLRLHSLVESSLSGLTLNYDTVYSLSSEWRILPAFDHPSEPARCLVTGTGLTHKASAANRDSMHETAQTLTDSMRMYKLGLEGGRPQPGSIGVAPEWFYKGTGTILRGHGDPLQVPNFGEDGGEEAEIAGVYVIDATGTPRRVGMTVANEFSDHKIEARNYLYLAPSKLRTCAIGPELVLDPDFSSVAGRAAIERGGRTVWSKEIATGDARMSHTLANLEHHHFKYEAHRRPGDAHIHFFGADAFSFGNKIALEDGDEMTIEFKGFGRPLRNPIRIDRSAESLIVAQPV
jgi:hypothetical protein